MVTSGAFQTETPLPASLRRPSRRPSITLRATRDPGGAMHVDAEQVALEAVVLDQRALRRSSQEDAGIHRLQVAARAPDGHAADGHVGRRHGDDAAGAAAVEHARRAVRSSTSAPIDPDRAVVFARRKFDDVAVLRAVQHRLQRLRPAQPSASPHWRSPDNPAATSAAGSMRDRRRTVSLPIRPIFGSTNMRPFISMCMA